MKYLGICSFFQLCDVSGAHYGIFLQSQKKKDLVNFLRVEPKLLETDHLYYHISFNWNIAVWPPEKYILLRWYVKSNTFRAHFEKVVTQRKLPMHLSLIIMVSTNFWQQLNVVLILLDFVISSLLYTVMLHSYRGKLVDTKWGWFVEIQCSMNIDRVMSLQAGHCCED